MNLVSISIKGKKPKYQKLGIQNCLVCYVPKRNNSNSATFNARGCDFSSACDESLCSSKPLKCITRERSFNSLPLFQIRKFYQHERYLGGGIHGGASSQQLLDKPHMALLGSQMESVESILQEKKQGLRSGEL